MKASVKNVIIVLDVVNMPGEDKLTDFDPENPKCIKCGRDMVMVKDTKLGVFTGHKWKWDCDCVPKNLRLMIG